jgi:curved DNA-binding protein CbpA
MNPFLVLNVPAAATDEQVRAAYQALVRRFPPEHHPERFQIIQEAYQSLRTPRDRANWRLLHLPASACHDLTEPLAAFAHLPGRMKPPGAAPFRDFLRTCATAAHRDSANHPTQPR